jgi:hypothetical protein
MRKPLKLLSARVENKLNAGFAIPRIQLPRRRHGDRRQLIAAPCHQGQAFNRNAPWLCGRRLKTRLECCSHHDEQSTTGAPQYMTGQTSETIQRH